MGTHNGNRPSIELVEAALHGAVRAHRAGHGRAVSSYVDDLALADEPRVVDTAVMATGRRAIQRAFELGWLPEDVYRFATRRTGAAAAAYLVDVIADHTDRHPLATVHHRWLDQVRGLDATVWWSGDDPHLSRWARRHGRARAAALTVAIEVLALLGSLPELPRVLPLPGTARGAVTSRTEPVDEKVLARVRALLAKAESTSFPDEAEALSAKAQELMTRHAFDRALLDSPSDARAATAHRIWLDNPYASAKVLLVQAVAGANRCRTMYYEKLGFVTVLGAEGDLRIVELLTTSLLVQATKAMLAKGSQIGHSGQSRTRSYRQAFLVAYAGRIGERLRGVTDAAARSESESSRLLPVLAARRQAVDELFASMFPTSVARPVSATNVAGWADGRAAADLARLETVRAVTR